MNQFFKTFSTLANRIFYNQTFDSQNPQNPQNPQNSKKSIFSKLFWHFQFWTFIFVHFRFLQNSLPKKKFFLMQQNEKSFFRKWERLVGKSLFRTFSQKNQKIRKFGQKSEKKIKIAKFCEMFLALFRPSVERAPQSISHLSNRLGFFAA